MSNTIDYSDLELRCYHIIEYAAACIIEALRPAQESLVFSNNLARLKVRFVPVIVRTQLECLRLQHEFCILKAASPDAFESTNI